MDARETCREAALAVVPLAELERHLVELAPQLLDARRVLIVAAIFRLELDFLRRLLAKIADRQPATEHVVAADLELGLVLGRKIVADGLEVADQVIERGVLADVDEILD